MIKVKNIPLSIIFGLVCVFLMYMIFMLSYQSGTDSAENSLFFYGLFLKITGFDFVSHNMFRKFAHFCEYCALGFFTCGAFTFAGLIQGGVFGGYVSFLYSVSDEMHQYFVPERACRIYDVFIDFFGILCGVLIFRLIITVFYRLLKKSK